MLFQGFVHPLLVWGMLAAAVPLVIHLLNRQRHKPLQWAAMEFVLAAYRKTRRRAQLENLLLLLLRMAAVALLALAIARPFTGDDSPLAPLTESRRDLVLVLDSSASAGYRESVESVHESILGRAREILEEFDGTRGDRVRLYSAGDRPRLVSARSPEDAIALLPTIVQPTDGALDLAALLAEIVSFAEEESAGSGRSDVEVRLLTDLQRGTFEPRIDADEAPDSVAPDAQDEGVPALRRALDRLVELEVQIVVEDLGAGVPTPPNLGVERVAPLGDVLGPGVSTEIGVTVRNHGTRVRSGIRVSLEVGGSKVGSQALDVVDARSTAEAVFQVHFKSSGAHAVVAALEGDRLQVDDQRATFVLVPEPIDVLLVNGDPHPEIDRDEVGMVRAILEPFEDDELRTRAGFAPFRATVVDAAAFGADEKQLLEPDVIVLANVPSLSARVFSILEKRVEAGAALLVTLGDRFNDRSSIEGFNARGWRADGTGLLPAKLFRAVEVPSRREAYYRCASFEETHPALEFFADERWRPFLTEVPIYGFVQTEPIENARVLARLDDEASSPLLVERAYNRGRVLLWTTSIDRSWNKIPDSPSTLIPLVHELLRYAARGRRPSLDVPVGGSIALEVDTFPRDAFLVEPDGTRRHLDGEPLEVASGLWELPPIGPLERAGVWRVEWEGGLAPFSVGIPPSEGDLDRISGEELLAQHRAWRIHDPSSSASIDDENEPERGELWRWLATLALAMLVGETLWAAWLGRKRRLA